jgi:hypothetical protein
MKRRKFIAFLGGAVAALFTVHVPSTILAQDGAD